MEGNVLLAFGLTLLAGLATGIGGAMAFFAKKTNTKFLSIALGFSAGVMIYVSFIEILGKAFESLTEELGDQTGSLITIISFFAGMVLIALIDKAIPAKKNPHEAVSVEDVRKTKPHQLDLKKSKLLRTGLMTALAIAIHNFPEGFATFMATIKDPALGISIAIAIAIHNIPEGIAVSIPVYYATGSRKKAFFYSFASGIAEPIGALLGYLILSTVMSETMFGVIFAGIAGIMVFISFDQLLPTAREYGEHHLSIYGLVSGMIVMAISLLLFI